MHLSVLIWQGSDATTPDTTPGGLNRPGYPPTIPSTVTHLLLLHPHLVVGNTPLEGCERCALSADATHAEGWCWFGGCQVQGLYGLNQGLYSEVENRGV